jgi:ribose transport system permease protein
VKPSRFSGLILWAMLIALFAILIPGTFLTGATVQSIASSQAITIILCLGIICCFSAGAFDLSIANNLGLVAVVCIVLITHGMNPVLASVLSIAIGTAIGVGNAVLVVVIGLDSFIATLGTSSILIAFTTMASGNQYVGPVSGGFASIATAQPGGIPVIIIYALVLAALTWWGLEHTPTGRRLSASGENPEAARLAGIRTSRYVAVTLVIAGATAGVAGVLLSASLGEVSPSIGTPYLLPTFAACFLGATQIKVGRFNVIGLLIAVFLLATGVQGIELAGGPVWVPDMFNGVALIAALALAAMLEKRTHARARQRSARTPLSNAEVASLSAPVASQHESAPETQHSAR